MRYPLGLQDRILAWYGGTVLAVLGLVLLLVHIRVEAETAHQVSVAMQSASRVVRSLQSERTSTLEMIARLAGKEPRLAAAIAGDPATGEPVGPGTIDDMLRSDLQHDFEVDFMRVTDARGRVRADTSGRARRYADLSRSEDVAAALRGKPWDGTLILPGEMDLVATAPVHVGDQDLGTVTVGRRVRDDLAERFHHDTGSEVTFFAARQMAASSWPATVRPALLCALAAGLPPGPRRPQSISMTLAGQRLMGLLIPMDGEDGAHGSLLIQANLDEALRPYTNIQRALAVIGLLGLLFAILGSMVVAGGITKPLQRIAHAAHGLMQGDWTQRTPVTSRDEIGLLAETFNRMAERLESWDADLRAAVAERTRDLNAAVAQLNEAYQQMRRFNADASHELRTPLTVIRGEAEVALRSERTGAEYQEVLRTVQEETERMSRIIEQLLLLARADSGELRLVRRDVALDDLVREVAHRMEVVARSRKIRLRTEPLEPVLLQGDEDQLGRLTLNLIDNAIKYTPEGGEVRVSVRNEESGIRNGEPGAAGRRQLAGGESEPLPAGSLRPTTGSPALLLVPHSSEIPTEMVALEVTDTGIGIEATDLPRIFDRFYRVDRARSRAQGGSGLGLAICQWIVEAHGGQIEVRSRPGVGTTFTVRLPGFAREKVPGAGLQA